MNDLERKLMQIVGVTEEEFQPKEKTTIEDVVEALDLLASIVLEESKQDD